MPKLCIVFLIFVFISACGDASDSKGTDTAPPDADGDVDTDSDTDSDADTDSGTDTGTNSDTTVDSETGSDTAVDTGSDTLVDTGSDTAVEGRGIYAIWYGSTIPDLPYVRGGQAMVNWEDVEPAEGQYDFSELEEKLSNVAQSGRLATVQINGNDKPDWLFDVVPHHPEKLSHQVGDEQGTLMYWHPVFREAHMNLIEAFAQFIASSPHNASVLGVRLNFNALGTEHTSVPDDKQDLSQWIVPTGASQGPAFSAAQVSSYQNAVVDEFVTSFGGDTVVFVRNNISDDLRDAYRTQFEGGVLGWFHTSSEAEPRAKWAEGQYETFFEFSRSGMTVSYAESWADAWGVHGSVVDDRWCDPTKWNYWRILFDLHCGVSAVAVYGKDLVVAQTGKYSSAGLTHDDQTAGTDYKTQFDLAFRFAQKYAGYHASPMVSPGAWVAFRENDIVLAENDMSEATRTLSTFTGDYNFLMERLDGPSTGDGVVNVGPEGIRFGAWARALPPGQTMRLKLADAFAKSLDGKPARVVVTYLDEGTGAMEVDGGGDAVQVDLSDTGAWATATIALNAASFEPDAQGAHIRVSGTTKLTLHMAEVTRE